MHGKCVTPKHQHATPSNTIPGTQQHQTSAVVRTYSIIVLIVTGNTSDDRESQPTANSDIRRTLPAAIQYSSTASCGCSKIT